ncbi:PQQ-dependent sugar dehydrogenase [Streptosporangium sp. NBC_01639]|uniref:PQQ-dependent sugar dehydrogenase n=1 Tax=Streptosporangium sp. NBC_01639 TaxID=2975948 RepID=UPI0038644A5E|nr:PQQ-dependent sugar dehydrogenase [Streptosporangium sp. NBC_01639]
MRWARINYIGDVPDGSGRKFVPDLNGKLYLLKNGAQQVYLDVGATFAPQFFSGAGMGQGFGFVTFHPEFQKNGIFYTVHTERASSATKPTDMPPQSGTLYHGVVTEWTADDPSASTFHGSSREILRLGFAGQIHGIQQIDFNPTAKRGSKDYGLLYVAVGDGGKGVGNTEPQNLSVPYGKIFRIDPRARNSAGGKYGIPADNPFVSRSGALGEIYAYGMRDPHRFSWDPAGRHRMFLGHIGEKSIESVYEVTAGANFGWSEREGRFVFDKTTSDPCDRLHPLPADDAKNGYTYPVAAYDHNPPPGWDCTSDVGRGISGGFVYRGHDAPELRGKYLFGDIVTGRVFYTDEREMKVGAEPAQIYELMVYDQTGKRVTTQDLAGDARVDFRFGRDDAGELYILSKANGKIWKVTGTRRFADCDAGHSRVNNTTRAQDWTPVTPAKWRFPGKEVVLAEAGQSRPGPRRPFEYAVLSAGPTFGSVHVDGEVRLDTPVDVTNRDVIVVFGYQSDTRFYYAHLSTDNTIYPHNGIFAVNDADRLRIEDQWDEARSRGAKPAVTDEQWHQVQVKHCTDSGEIAVYLDGAKTPLMTAVDTTFTSGRVGFGSFDNIGRLRDLKVTGTRVND